MRFVFDYLEDAKWGRQHRWRRAIWSTMARMGLTGIHGLPLHRHWVEVHDARCPCAAWTAAWLG